MNTPFFTKVLLILKDYCDKEHGGNMRAASRALGLDPETGVLFRWLQCLKENPKNKRAPNLETVGPCMDHIGVLLLAPEEVPNIEGRLDKRFPHEKIIELRREIETLRRQIDTLRTERDMARGQAQALKEQLERLIPVSEKNHQQSSSNKETDSNE